MITITIYQERRTERVLEALRDLSSPRALVIRDGAQLRIPGREVVREDVVLLREGDRVPADATLLESTHLSIDESLLTGESVPVEKTLRAPSVAIQAGDASDRVFAGTLVVKGHGIASVTATGSRTQMGRIGTSLSSLGIEATALQAETRRLVGVFSAVAAVLCLVLGATYLITRGDWLNALLAALTLAMAILPEEFPVVLTVFLALGAWRMSRANVLTRRVAAIEALGAASVLCVDKTGTLTQNRMSVQELHVDGKRIQVNDKDRLTLGPEFSDAIAVSVLASEPQPFDPMERAFHDVAAGRAMLDGELVRRYALSADLLAVTHVWRHADGKLMTVASKGAPESIAALCGLPPAEAQRVLRDASAMAERGLRVLGLAKRELTVAPLPDDPRALAPTFVGLIGLADPLRPTVPAAMRECHEAGVRVVMITGDYPATAIAIARQAGLAELPRIVTGVDLDQMTDEALRTRLATIDVFARVVPEQKLRIVLALKARGDVVAMTGDGVNDAPALKAADIGIAMGGRGTDVAREAASIVLLDDDFGSIVQAIRQGRRIFDNLRKAMSYVVAVHTPIAGLSLLPVLFGMPAVLYPAHILFLEFIIDPACSIAFEAEDAEPEVMRRPPRDPAQSLIGASQLVLALLEGGIALLFTLGVYYYATATGHTEAETRMLAFTGIVLANLSLIFFTRSGGTRVWQHIVARNTSLWWVVAGTLVAYAVVLTIPPLREIFRFGPWSMSDVGVVLPAVLALWLALAVLQGGHSVARRWWGVAQ